MKGLKSLKLAACAVFALCINSAFAQPTKPDYQSSTAYIIWYDNYMSYHQNNNGYSGGGSTGGSAPMSASQRRLNRLERKMNNYLREQQRQDNLQSQVNLLNDQANMQFWNAVACYEKGDYPGAIALYSNYEATLSRQMDYSNKNKVMANNTKFGAPGQSYEEYEYYHFMINFVRHTYTNAFLYNPYTVFFNNTKLDCFPYSTIAFFGQMKTISSASYRDLRGYFAIIRLFGQLNINQDAMDILNKFSPGVKDSIQNDDELRVQYGLAQISARDYQAALKTFNDIVEEANSPLFEYAVAKEIGQVVLDNPTHDSVVMKYTCGLLETAARQTTDNDLLSRMDTLKQKILALYRKSSQPNCNALTAYSEKYSKYGTFEIDPFIEWENRMAACKRFGEVKKYLEDKLKEKQDKKINPADYLKNAAYPDVAQAAWGLDNNGYTEEAVQLYKLYSERVLGNAKRSKRIKAEIEVHEAKLFYEKGDYKKGIDCIDTYFARIRKWEQYEYMWVTDIELWTALCKIKMLLNLNRPDEAISLWQQIFNSNTGTTYVNVDKSFPILNKYLTPEDMNVLVRGVMKAK